MARLRYEVRGAEPHPGPDATAGTGQCRMRGVKVIIAGPDVRLPSRLCGSKNDAGDGAISGKNLAAGPHTSRFQMPRSAGRLRGDHAPRTRIAGGRIYATA